MRHRLTSTFLLSAVLAASTGLACAQGAGSATAPAPGAPNLDGTGAGLNAGPGSAAQSDRSGNRDNATGTAAERSPRRDPAPRVDGTNAPRVLGNSAARAPTGQSNATVGINGTGTLDGSVPAQADEPSRDVQH
jgi:hypothetical protein